MGLQGLPVAAVTQLPLSAQAVMHSDQHCAFNSCQRPYLLDFRYKTI